MKLTYRGGDVKGRASERDRILDVMDEIADVQAAIKFFLQQNPKLPTRQTIERRTRLKLEKFNQRNDLGQMAGLRKVT